MAREVEITGEQFREKLQGEHSFALDRGANVGRHRYASPMSRATIEDKGIIPWQIPEPVYYSLGGEMGRMALASLPLNLQEIPTYIITTRTILGGSISYDGPNTVISTLIYPCVVNITGCTFKEYIELMYVSSNYEIKFEDCTFENYVQIDKNQFKKISFLNCIFRHQYIAIGYNETDILNFSKCTAKQLSIYQANKVLSKELIFSNTTLESLNIHGREHGIFLLDNLMCDSVNLIFDSVNMMFSESKSTGQPIAKKVYFDRVTIKADGQNKSKLLLKNINTSVLELTGFLTSTVHLKDISFANLKIVDLVNDGKLQLHNLSLDSAGTVVISDSQLGKAELNYVNFKNARTFRVYLSNLSELTTNNTIFPGIIVGYDEDDYSGVREIYRQLKNSAYKQGDRISELRYEQLEMLAFDRVLSTDKSFAGRRDKFVLLTNKLSNDHGQDWLKSLVVLFGLSILPYMFIKTLININYTYHPFSFENFAQYLNFTLNPLHRFKELFMIKDDAKYGYVGIAETIDILSRLFSGYMVFQFLKAFRKFAK